MKNGFRQSMAWLHTWCGLTCGWLLCAIMLTGTLSVFREPITRWMQARPALQEAAAADSGMAVPLEQAVRHLAQQAPGARLWRIEFPAHPGDAMLLIWRQGRTQEHAALHPVTGALLPQPWGRATEGGRHFMSFHYLLHAGMPGYWLVGWVSMCMLVGLVSGVVVHRRIFQDFFTFRPGKGQRSWLDAHNATAVTTLPFLLMIVYTGLFIFYTSYMPWPMRTVYGSEPQAHARFQGELLQHAAEPPDRSRAGEAAALVPLAPLLAQARQLLGQPARALVVEQPGDLHATVRVLGRVDENEHPSRTLLNPAGSVAFDGVSGAVLQLQRHDPGAAFATEQVHGVMESLHFARFGGWSMRWLYFFSGLVGTVMVATGTVLFSVKRRQKSGKEFGRATAGVYRCIDALGVASVAGICVACIAFFHANRLLPVELAQRPQWEIRAFLWIWLATLVHAALRPPRRAWVEQLGTAAALCLALPALNAASTGQHLLGYAGAADWQRMSVELVALGLGLALAWTAWRTQRGWRAKPVAQPRRGAAMEARA
ncbi:PepSY-associated TM helix domain-containing protein [Comamonas endophytica]|uniref:PepSY domain-containing protein n=1 Tax=Comamonas endophytica TaxID=2949090 RepID=A0ABY6G6I4_9BURK|nr:MULTISPECIES: PepSY-associated TM helix domain-containing protein [unclassified Acidovorax]MCD2511240.1 PepSY domain-containing protein [Acidovorax sp. D4N7]UYG50636.1 PepSY domain-containing protein [Acidovorax sp. 5MLIR]